MVPSCGKVAGKSIAHFSTAITTATACVEYGEMRYRAFGEQRYASGTTPTTFRFTGQREEQSLGLYFYNARWYDPAMGRFVQADPIVPEASQGTQASDRFAYVNNNPVNYTDPTGYTCSWTNPLGCVQDAILTITTIYNIFSGNPFGSERDQALNAELAKVSEGGVPDITGWAVNAMNTNATGPISSTLRDANSEGVIGRGAAFVGWVAMVEPGAPWDYKVDFNKRGINTVIMGGQKFSYEAVANMMYGFNGLASGFTEQELLVGAGVAQAFSDIKNAQGDISKIGWENWDYNFDQPYDQGAIMFGMWLYKYLDGAQLTEDIFQQFIQDYGVLLQPPEESN